MAGPNVDNANGDYTPRCRVVGSEFVGEIAPAASSAAVTDPAQAAAAVQLLAANDNRIGIVIENDSDGHVADLLVKFGSGAALDDYTRRIKPGEAWDRPLCPYKGVITGIWTAAGAGHARVTEEVAS